MVVRNFGPQTICFTRMCPALEWNESWGTSACACAEVCVSRSEMKRMLGVRTRDVCVSRSEMKRMLGCPHEGCVSLCLCVEV